MLCDVLDSKPSEHLHHIVPVAVDPNSRMDPKNWLSLCVECHEILEGNQLDGMQVKAWSRANYETKLNEGLGHG